MNTIDLKDFRTRDRAFDAQIQEAEEATNSIHRRINTEKTNLQKGLRKLLEGGHSTGNSLQDTLLLLLPIGAEKGIQNVLDFSQELERSKGKLLLLTHYYQGMHKHVMMPTEGNESTSFTEDTSILGRLSGETLMIERVKKENEEEEIAFSLRLPFEKYVYEDLPRGQLERLVNGAWTVPWGNIRLPSAASILRVISEQEIFSILDALSGNERTELKIGEPNDFKYPNQIRLINELDYIPPTERQEGGS